MSTLAIILGAIALAILVFGITATASVVCRFGRQDKLHEPLIITIIGAIGFYLCLVL